MLPENNRSYELGPEFLSQYNQTEDTAAVTYLSGGIVLCPPLEITNTRNQRQIQIEDLF